MREEERGQTTRNKKSKDKRKIEKKREWGKARWRQKDQEGDQVNQRKTESKNAEICFNVFTSVLSFNYKQKWYPLRLIGLSVKLRATFLLLCLLPSSAWTEHNQWQDCTKCHNDRKIYLNIWCIFYKWVPYSELQIIKIKCWPK